MFPEGMEGRLALNMSGAILGSGIRDPGLSEEDKVNWCDGVTGKYLLLRPTGAHIAEGTDAH